MERIRTVEVGTHIGERVRVAGWLHSLRRLGGISFLVIRDGWGIIQAVAETEVELGPLQDGSIGLESIVAVEGDVVGETQAPGGVELQRVSAPCSIMRLSATAILHDALSCGWQQVPWQAFAAHS